MFEQHFLQVPKEKCTTAYKLNCHKVPKEKCRTIKVICLIEWILITLCWILNRSWNVIQQKSRYLSIKHREVVVGQQRRETNGAQGQIWNNNWAKDWLLICRRSDDDVFLDESSDYSHSGEYLDGYMETPIDYVEVFPDNFHGSPNLTVTPDGRRFRPQYRADVLVVDDVYDEDLYDDDDGYRGSSFLHNQAPYDAAQSQVYE